MRKPPPLALGLVATAAVGLGAGAARAQVSYTIVDLTEAAEEIGVVQSEARAISEDGAIVGFEVVSLGIERAIMWHPDGTAELLPALPRDNSTAAVGITDDGRVLGVSEAVTIEMVGEITFIFEDQKAAVWQADALTDLNDLVIGGDTFIDLRWTQDANADGQLVGWASLSDGPPFDSNGFLLDDGIVTDLGALQRPVAINDHGLIVGWNRSGQDHAFLWEDGVTVDLHDTSVLGGVTSRAYGVDNAGRIVGEAQFDISKPEEATIWIDGVPVRLVPDFDRPQGVASAVNERGQVVGWYNDLDDLSTGFFGFIWQDGVRQNLCDLIDPDEGWEILFPFDVNERGQIVGGGFRNGMTGRAFVMTPTCAADLDGDGIVGFTDLVRILATWGPCDGCPEDLDGSGDVGFADLVAVIAAWGSCLGD